MTDETKLCIACAEDIKAEALLCKFCGTTQTDGRFTNGSNDSVKSPAPADVIDATPHKMSTGSVVAITLSIVVVFGIAVAVVLWLWWGSAPNSAESAPPSATPSSSEFNIAGIYEAALPSIVTVNCGSDLGSGFAYQLEPASGYRTVIVTNEHVISQCTFEGGPLVTVEPYRGQAITGTLWSWDAENDLATIMIRQALPPLIAASPASIGDSVLVMGTPSGLQGSVTTGIISQVYTDAYQTDAAMNRGNSGGPLLDREGRVLGVNTLGLGREGLNIAFRVELLCKKVVTCG